MGNNVACKTVGIGTIKIKMYDGIVRTLAEVWHIPDLKKNLISLGSPDSNGSKVSAEGGVIKVVKGALVLTRGNRVGNLYISSGNTITSGVAVVKDQQILVLVLRKKKREREERLWNLSYPKERIDCCSL